MLVTLFGLTISSSNTTYSCLIVSNTLETVPSMLLGSKIMYAGFPIVFASRYIARQAPKPSASRLRCPTTNTLLEVLIKSWSSWLLFLISTFDSF